MIDKQYQINYEIKNLRDVDFLGAVIIIEMFWSSLGPFLVNKHPMSIVLLRPGLSEQFKFDQLPKVSGITVLLQPKFTFYATDRKEVELYLPNGNLIPPGQVVHSIRIRSPEEINQSINNKITAISLVILIFFQIIDWIFRYFGIL